MRDDGFKAQGILSLGFFVSQARESRARECPGFGRGRGSIVLQHRAVFGHLLGEAEDGIVAVGAGFHREDIVVVGLPILGVGQTRRKKGLEEIDVPVAEDDVPSPFAVAPIGIGTRVVDAVDRPAIPQQRRAGVGAEFPIPLVSPAVQGNMCEGVVRVNIEIGDEIRVPENAVIRILRCVIVVLVTPDIGAVLVAGDELGGDRVLCMIIAEKRLAVVLRLISSLPATVLGVMNGLSPS